MINTIPRILSAALIASLAELLAPRGEGGKTAAYVRMIAGLFILVALSDPLREGLGILREATEGDPSAFVESLLPEVNATDYGDAFYTTLTEISRREAETWVRARLESEFGIPPGGCALSVTCTKEGESVIFTETRIALRGDYILTDPHPIEQYFEERLGCPCFVTVSVG